MEFVEYQQVLPGLTKIGLVEVQDENDHTRLELDPSPKLRTHHFRDPASEVPPYPEATVSERPKSELPETIEEILGRLHLTEVLAIPVSEWGDIVDCVAYDLASDEEWQEIDAIAAVHQNTRNALAITRGENRLLVAMMKALFNHAEGPRHDISLVSDAKPFLLEVFHDGAISLTCERGFMDELMKSIEESSPKK